MHHNDEYAKIHENGSFGKNECWYVLDSADSFVLITLGTGVCGGVIIDGKPYRGFNCADRELGHACAGNQLQSRRVHDERIQIHKNE